MNSTLILCNYNNYYNRIIKKYDIYSSYIQNEDSATIENINFIPGDGVTTEQIINWNPSHYDWTPDYLVVVDDSDNIVSRWFIVESEQTRGQQYKLSLRRDVIADNYEDVINAPMYIEKATVKDISDPAIFNTEDISFNEIKKDEVLLKDNSNCAWLVAYFDCNQEKTDFDNLFAGQTITYGKPSADIIVNHLSELKYNHYIGSTQTVFNENSLITILLECSTTNSHAWSKLKVSKNEITLEATNRTVEFTEGSSFEWGITAGNKSVKDTLNGEWVTANNHGIYGYLKNETFPSDYMNYFDIYHFRNDYESVKSYYHNKTIFDNETNKYYKVVFTESTYDDWKTINMSTSLGLTYKNATAKPNIISYLENFSNRKMYGSNLVHVTIALEEQPNAAGIGSISTTSITPKNLMMKDAPYCSMCIPFMEGEIQDLSGTSTTITKEMCFSFGSLLSRCLGEHLYDIQLLPYCPLPQTEYYYDEDLGKLELSQSISIYRVMDFNVGDGVHKIPGIFYFDSTFHKTIDYEIDVSSNPLKFKVDNETNKYRLCSGTYNSIFEFNPYMNYGVNYFNVDCTYKPYKSYVHVAPNFKELYGSFQDQRGLVITGDFSIPQISDSWQSYQINNKNYSQIFERGISNMELNNAWNMAGEISGAVTGSISGIAGSIVAGSMAGGTTGAAIGGVLGGVTGIAGGIADIIKTSQLQNEAIDYTTDLYNYNLQNIQAQPDTLKSVSSFDANTRLFPFIEVFTCTDIEKEALENKLKYNGMKIGRIGSINDFVSSEINYIKGQLIRLNDIHVDFHEANAIAGELFKGVFI